MARTATARARRKGPDGIPGPTEIRSIIERFLGPKSIMEPAGKPILRPVTRPLSEKEWEQRKELLRRQAAEIQAQESATT